MRNTKFKRWILLLLFVLGCSGQSSIKDEYVAERMYHKANRLYQSILINPRIASAKDYQRAINAFQAIVEKYGKGQTVSNHVIKLIVEKSWLIIPELYFLQEDYKGAIAGYKAVIEANPENPQLCAAAQMSIASCYERIKQIDKAILEYQNLLSNYSSINDPSSPNLQILQVPLHIARLYQQMDKASPARKQYEEAIRYYQGIANKWPKTPTAFVALNQIAATYADQRKWEKTVDVLREIVREFPDHQRVPDILLAMGNIYLELLREPSRALEVYNRILKSYPNYKNQAQVHLAIGYALLRQHKFQSAREKFKQVIQTYPKNGAVCAGAQFALGNTYELEDKWERALNEYRWVMDVYPTTPQGIYVPIYIADHYKRNNEDELAKAEYQRAINHYQRLVRKYPNSLLAAMAQNYLAMCYVRQEEWEEAIEAFRTLGRAYPPSSVTMGSYLMLGNIYEQLKDKLKAIEAYSEFVTRFPDHPLAKTVKGRIKRLQSEIGRVAAKNVPPAPVTLLAISKRTQSSLTLKWTPNDDLDFASYKVFRSQSPGVDSTSALVATITDQKKVIYYDTGLEANKSYFYRVYVYDKDGLSSGSNEVSGRTLANVPPAKIALRVHDITWCSVALSWTQSREEDFAFYKVFRSRSPGVNTSSRLVKFTSDRERTSYTDANLQENTTYYYRVYVYDAGGLFTPSNEVKVTTPTNEPPRPVVLKTPVVVDKTTLRLSWSRSKDEDFAMYRIYRSSSPSVKAEGAPLKIISDRETTSYEDSGVTPGRRYFYRVFVFDRGGLSAGSNEVSAIPVSTK